MNLTFNWNHKPKFNIGDTVRCQRKSKTFGDFDFTGKVTKRADTGDEWEYHVTNAPSIFLGGPSLLVWESEMTLVRKS